jgi:type I site-specific restriction endonuclease
MNKCNVEASNLIKERNQIKTEVDALKARLQDAETRAGKAESKAESDIRDQIRRLERALEDAINESSRRVSETSQFKQMKAMMQTQSKKMVELRRRLNQYEPEDSKNDDDF